MKELLDLAKQCFRHAEICQNPQAAETLRVLGQQYMDEASEIERRRGAVRAIFPKIGSRMNDQDDGSHA